MARKLVVEIIGDASSLEKAYRRGTTASSGFGRSIASTAAKVAGAVGGLYILEKAAHSAWTEFSDGQKVFAQTNAVIKSTGGVANVTAKQVQGLAKSLENISGIDDEVIQGGEQLLLTFKNIRNQAGKGNDIFNQSTKALLDMQVAMSQAGKTGDDIKNAAIRLGKALNDPIKGLTSLRRVGVTFSDSQIKAIKGFVKTGDVMKAQKIILGELTSEFGGSAKALGDTVPGQLNKLRNALNDIGGDIIANLAGGSPAVGALQRLVTYLQDAGNQQRIVQRVSDALRSVSNVLQSLIGPIQTVVSAMGGLKNVLIGIISLKVASAVAGLVGPLNGVAGSATNAAAQTSGLAGQLGRLAKIGAIAIGIDMIFRSKGDSTAIAAFQRIGGGAALGFAVGGPAGAVVGGAAGAVVSGILDKRKDNLPFDTAMKLKKLQDSGLGTNLGIVDTLLGTLGTLPGADVPGYKETKYKSTPYSYDGGGGGGGGGAKGEPAWMKQLRRLQLILSKAQLTKPLTDDVTALGKIISFLKAQLRLHKNDLDLQKELVDAQGQMIDLRKQERDALKSAMDDVRGRIPGLFDPLSEDAIRQRLGFRGPDVGVLTANLKASNQQVATWQSNLAKLAKRGAPHDLITELQGMGVSGAANVAALASAGGGALSAFFAQYRARQKQIARIAKIEIAAQNVTIVAPRGAGGPLRPPDRGQPNLSIYLDGNDITKSTLTRTQRKQRQTAAQVRGRIGGIKVF